MKKMPQKRMSVLATLSIIMLAGGATGGLWLTQAHGATIHGDSASTQLGADATAFILNESNVIPQQQNTCGPNTYACGANCCSNSQVCCDSGKGYYLAYCADHCRN